MSALLIFPPVWSINEPYLSLPSLTAYLRQKGVSVDQIDFNLEFFNTILTPPYLEQAYDLLQKKNHSPAGGFISEPS